METSKLYTHLSGVFDSEPAQGGPTANEGTPGNREKKIRCITLAIVHEESVNNMWTEYLKDVDEFDTGLTETWKEDAGGVLTFVSLNLLVPAFVSVTN